MGTCEHRPPPTGGLSPANKRRLASDRCRRTRVRAEGVRSADRLTAPLLPLWRRGFRLLFVVDGMVLFGSMIAINWARFGRHWPDFSLTYYLAGFAIATVIHLVIGYLTGIYER